MVRQQQLLRELAASRRADGAPPVGGVTGVRSLPVICVNFKNVPPPFTTNDYQTLLFDTTVGRKTMTQYYRDASNGKLEVSGTVLGWYALPENDTFYENGSQGDGEPFGELLKLGLERADADTDFGAFDNDGPDGRPNSGDDDGKVDTVVFIHPEHGAECDRGPNIWSHSWHYSHSGYGHNGPFVTRAIRLDADGKPVLGPGGEPEHIVVDDYVIQPGLSCPGQGTRIIEIGVFCHEYGHALSLPDLYDRTPQAGADSAGVGNWCLMAGGSYGGDGRHPQTPASMSAWCKEYLGWSVVQPISQNGQIDFEPVEERNVIHRIEFPNTGGKEYLLVEYRNGAWADPTGMRINWDADLPVQGLAIWHVDRGVGEQVNGGFNSQWPFAPPDQGQNDSPSLPNKPRHALVALLQADRRLNLERGEGRGDGGDLLVTGGVFEDDATLVFGSRGYNKLKSDISLTAVDLSAQTAFVRVVSDDPGPNGTASTGAGVPIVAAPAAVATPPGGAAPGRNAAPSPYPAPVAAAPGAAPKARKQPPITGPVKTAGAQSTYTAAALADLNQKLNHANSVARDRRAPGGRPVKGIEEIVDVPSSANQKTIQRLNLELEKLGEPQVSDDEIKSIKAAPRWEIAAAVDMKNQSAVRSLAAEGRSKSFTASSQPANAAEARVIDLVKKSAGANPAYVQMAPSGSSFERITGLAIPAKYENPLQDATDRVRTDLKPVLGDGVVLKAWPSQEYKSTNAIVRFHQVIERNGIELPVFETQTDLYYTNGGAAKLTAVVNRSISTNGLEISGTPGALSIDQARKIVMDTLRLDPTSLKAGREGVYLIGGDPKRARIAVTIPVAIDTNHQDLRIYIDSTSREILEIK
jgi:M6 family metalloprotease-like protein